MEKTYELAFEKVSKAFPNLDFRDIICKTLVLQRLFDRFGLDIEIDLSRL